MLIKEHQNRRWMSSFVNPIYNTFYNCTSVLGKCFNDIYLFLKRRIILGITCRRRSVMSLQPLTRLMLQFEKKGLPV